MAEGCDMSDTQLSKSSHNPPSPPAHTVFGFKYQASITNAKYYLHFTKPGYLRVLSTALFYFWLNGVMFKVDFSLIIKTNMRLQKKNNTK